MNLIADVYKLWDGTVGLAKTKVGKFPAARLSLPLPSTKCNKCSGIKFVLKLGFPTFGFPQFSFFFPRKEIFLAGAFGLPPTSSSFSKCPINFSKLHSVSLLQKQVTLFLVQYFQIYSLFLFYLCIFFAQLDMLVLGFLSSYFLLPNDFDSWGNFHESV